MRENLRTVSPRDRVLYLRSLPSFQGVSTEDLMAVARLLREVHFKRGQTIYAKHSSVEAAYLLIEGRISLERPDGANYFVSAPMAVGFFGVATEIEVPGDVVANTNVLALEIPSDSLVHLWEQNFTILENSLRLAATAVLHERGGWPYDVDSPPEFAEADYPEASFTLVDLIRKQRAFLPFRGVNLEAVAELCRHQREVRYPPGTTLWREGEPGEFFLRVMYGTVEIEQVESDTRGSVGYDYSIGFMETMAQLPRTYSATARTEVVAIRSDLDTLLSVFEDQFDLAFAALSTLSSIAIERMWQTGDLSALTR